MNGMQNAAPYEILFKYTSYAHQIFLLWESLDADRDDAYIREFKGDYNISQYKSWGSPTSVTDPYAVCVYNPNRKPKIFYSEYIKQKINEQKKRQEQLKKQQEQNAKKDVNYEDSERYFQKTNNQSQNNTNKTRVESAEDDLF